MAECATSNSQKGSDQDSLPLAAADSNGTGVTSVAVSLPPQPSYGLRKRDRNHDVAQENVVDGQRGKKTNCPESVPPTTSEFGCASQISPRPLPPLLACIHPSPDFPPVLVDGIPSALEIAWQAQTDEVKEGAATRTRSKKNSASSGDPTSPTRRRVQQSKSKVS